MADTMIAALESNTHNTEGSSDHPAPSSNGSLFHRRIEFHMARKPFTGFSNGGGDFRLETLNPRSEGQRAGPNHGGGPSSMAGKKSDALEVSENGLDPELSFGITFRRIGAGLENLGNTCFLNAVLQCLTYTEPLAAYLQSGKHQTSCRTAGFCALCAIQKHVSRALQATGRILAPKDLVSNLRCISRNFRNARQEDAHEYMVNLLESMHKCCLPSGVPSESPSAYEKSLVHKIFGGRLRSQVKCMQCSFCSNKFDPFLDLSLEIFKADSLYKALSHFTAKEQLDGGERQYQCQRCKHKVKALKQLTVHKAPYVLTIHLKRFGSHVPGQKIDKKVVFGPTLDLKPFVSGPYDGELKYTLYGVLVHAGWSTHSGHYYCFVRTSSGMWYSLDDNRVVQVNERTVLEQKAYMLFYVRDRRNFAPKKPVDVAQKENMTINGMGNKTLSNPNHAWQEMIQNHLSVKKLKDLGSSANVYQNDALNAGRVKVTQKNETSVQRSDGLINAECKKAIELGSLSNLLPLKDSVKNLSVGRECLPQSAPSVKSPGDTLRLDNTVIRTAGKVNDCDDDEKTKENLNNYVATTPQCNGVQDSVTKMDPSDSIAVPLNCNEDRNTKKDLSDPVSGGTCVTDNTSSQKNDIKASSKDPIGKIDPVRSPNLTCNEDSQIRGFPGKSASGASSSEKICDIGQNMVVGVESVESSSLPATICTKLVGKSHDRKPHIKPKKMLFKYQVASMHIGSNILIAASLRLLKKKKHKRSKPRTLEIKNLTHGHFLDGDCLPTDLGPSTSEKSSKMSHGGSAPSGRTRVNSDLNKKDNMTVVKNVTNCNGDSSLGATHEELRERACQNGTVLATAKQPQKSFCAASGGNQLDARGTIGPKGSVRDEKQSSMISILTRGLEETIVERWDGIELPPVQIAESSNGARVSSIGYVADEWDEEYDRGKRKKVRGPKFDFDGPNPFQEIATKKAKLKMVKIDQQTSRNGPFRI